MMTSSKLSRDIPDFFQFFESFYGAKYVWKVSSLYHFSIVKKVGGVILPPPIIIQQTQVP